MSCDYAYDAGRHKAINQFHKVLNELLTDATNMKRQEVTNQNEYWRIIGKQDILLQLLDVVCEMIKSPH
jgi:hypothetical protein